MAQRFVENLVLVVVQVAVALVLITGAGLLVRSGIRCSRCRPASIR